MTAKDLVEAKQAAEEVRQDFEALRESIERAMSHGLTVAIQIKHKGDCIQVENPPDMQIEMTGKVAF